MHKYKQYTRLFVFSIIAFIFLFPIIYLIVFSVFHSDTGFSLMNYYKVFLAKPDYLIKFWRSLAMCLMIAAGQTLFFLYVRNSICKIFFSSEKILVYTICTIYDFTDSGNTVAELYFIRKTKTFKQLESFDNPCNIFTFWNCMAYFRFPGNPRFYT